MKEIRFSIDIGVVKEKVWQTLWQDETFRIWADLIDPGTYMVGNLEEGKEVQFISAENGYGVTSLVAELVENEYLLLKHSADTQESGSQEREKEWTGGTESYSLEENDGKTTLTVAFDVPPQQEAYFEDVYPNVMERIKALAEA